MTIATERYRAVRYLKEAAMMIYLRGKERPSLAEFRQLFRAALRHYPSDFDMQRVAECKKCRKIFERE